MLKTFGGTTKIDTTVAQSAKAKGRLRPEEETMDSTNESVENPNGPTEAELRARILTQFQERWNARESLRRVALLEEIVPRIPDYAKLNNARVDIKVHPEHLEFYISQLLPKVRAVIEFVPSVVMNKVLNSHTTDEKIAKVIRLVNMLDEKALDRKAAETEEDPG